MPSSPGAPPRPVIRALLVDDSTTARMSLRHALEQAGDIRVIGEAANGHEALAMLPALGADIVLLDVYLGRDNGVDVAARIMARAPRPILIVTAANPSDPALVFRALEAGVLDLCAKVPAPQAPHYDEACRSLVRLVRVLARVPVVHRARTSALKPLASPTLQRRGQPGLVVLGASTGGPPVLKSILAALPRPFPLPIAVVQHITEGFGAGFAEWLQTETRHPTRLVDRVQFLEAGVVYSARDGAHLKVLSPGTIGVSDEPPVHFQKPAVDVLFESAARHLPGGAVAVLLTGMGSDGVAGLGAVQRAGGVTIAQAPATCVVDSMPAGAISRGVAGEVLPPEQIATAIVRSLSGSS